MVRCVLAEERFLDYLSALSKQEGCTIGLILGQTSGQKDFIVHLAKTPPPATKDVVEETLISTSTNTYEKSTETCINSVKDIPASWVADHVKHVTRMLPGGMYVLGIFIVSAEDVLNNQGDVQKLKSILSEIHKNLSWNKYLHGKHNPEDLILSYNKNSQKYIGKTVDVMKDGILRPTDWKFQTRPTKWRQLETRVDLDRTYNISADKDPEPLKKQLQDILKNISDMVDSTLVVIENEVRPLEDSIEMIGKTKQDKKDYKNRDTDSEDKPLQVNLYIPCPVDSNLEVKVTPCTASMHLVGQMVSRTFVHQKATIEEAVTAVKQDIVRSLASRLQMHWDSLIEEESGSPEEKITLHEPPRRVLVALPYSNVTLSDYLFPGEGPQEALISLQELLDLQVQENKVEKDLELQVDPSELYCHTEIDPAPVENSKDSAGSSQFMVYYVGIAVSILMLIAAVLLQLFY